LEALLSAGPAKAVFRQQLDAAARLRCTRPLVMVERPSRLAAQRSPPPVLAMVAQSLGATTRSRPRGTRWRRIEVTDEYAAGTLPCSLRLR